MNRNIHIVAFDVPYPPDYGGAIDIFYRLKSLFEAGAKIHLHCFEYHRKRKDELSRYCQTVNYYLRPSGIRYFFSSVPYIVNTRISKELKNNLLADNHPILLEGLHTCQLLTDIRFRERIILVRSHNIEHEYYSNLAELEKNILKRMYFISESKKLKSFEKVLLQAGKILPISLSDEKYFISKSFTNTCCIPPFHPYTRCETVPGKGEYVLYHGNLSVNENAAVALFLANNVFSKVKTRCIIAGKNPVKEVRTIENRFDNITVISNPQEGQMNRLISDAHVNILPSFTPTGMKLKLISALFSGRFCITNGRMIENTGLDELCLIRESADEMIITINGLMNTSFTPEMIDKRQKVLELKLSNTANALTIMQLI